MEGHGVGKKIVKGKDGNLYRKDEKGRLQGRVAGPANAPVAPTVPEFAASLPVKNAGRKMTAAQAMAQYVANMNANAPQWARDLAERTGINGRKFDVADEDFACVRSVAGSYEGSVSSETGRAQLTNRLETVGLLRAQHFGTGVDYEGLTVEYYVLPALPTNASHSGLAVIRHARTSWGNEYETGRLHLDRMRDSDTYSESAFEADEPHRSFMEHRIITDEELPDMYGLADSLEDFWSGVVTDESGRPVALEYRAFSGEWDSEDGSSLGLLEG